MGDLFQSEVFGDAEIVLHDINADALERVRQAGDAFIAEHQLAHRLSATTDRAEALAGADFCIISIEVGNRFDLWEQDWRIPQQFGIRQVYGENGGPGGLFHSLRIIPPIVEICADIERICPGATVFNYSNPMSRICTTVRRRFPALNFIGLCHEIASLERHVPAILELPYAEMQLRAGGLNHFSVLLAATHTPTGRDLYPDLLARAPAYFDSLPGFGDSLRYYWRHGSWPASREELQVDPARLTWPEREVFRIMMEQFGVFPITTDSHFGEYLQWAHDAADLAGILDFYSLYKQFLANSEAKIELKLSERVVPIMEGIVTDAGYEEGAVNVPNGGIFPDLPDWLVVEVPALVDRGGVHALSPGALPKGFGGLLANQVAVHDLTAEAALTGSRAAVKQALLVDPVVDIYRNLDELIDTMLAYQPQHLGYVH